MKKPAERVSTGIPGLDKVLEGGFIPGTIVLLSGEAGTGKTIFSTQFLWKNMVNGMKGLYITLQQLPEDILDDMEHVSKDLRSAITKNQFKMIYVDIQRVKKLVEIIVEYLDEMNAKLLVVDSITLFCEVTDKAIEIRYNMVKLMKELKKRKVTTVLISEAPIENWSKFGVEEFVCDGVILLRAGVDVIGGSPRSLIVKKMRRTSHDMQVHPLEIDKSGMKLIDKK
jgi:KaiC/GvpD/RAD55 family RecA-like ATPase